MTKKVPKYSSSKDCPDINRHTPQPEGYFAYPEWAEKKSKGFKQIRCPTCGFFAVWIKKS